MTLNSAQLKKRKNLKVTLCALFECHQWTVYCADLTVSPTLE